MIANRRDRRRRNPFDPAVSMTVSMPLTLKIRLEDAVVARRSTISGIIRQALLEWLERNEPDAHAGEQSPDGSTARSGK